MSDILSTLLEAHEDIFKPMPHEEQRKAVASSDKELWELVHQRIIQTCYELGKEMAKRGVDESDLRDMLEIMPLQQDVHPSEEGDTPSEVFVNYIKFALGEGFLDGGGFA